MIHPDHLNGESFRRWHAAEQAELLHFVRQWNPPAELSAMHANFVTVYQLSLDLNQPAGLRDYYRDEAVFLAWHLRYCQKVI